MDTNKVFHENSNSLQQLHPFKKILFSLNNDDDSKKDKATKVPIKCERKGKKFIIKSIQVSDIFMRAVFNQNFFTFVFNFHRKYANENFPGEKTIEKFLNFFLFNKRIVKCGCGASSKRM